MDISESELLENLEYVVERFLKIEGFPRVGERVECGVTDQELKVTFRSPTLEHMDGAKIVFRTVTDMIKSLYLECEAAGLLEDARLHSICDPKPVSKLDSLKPRPYVIALEIPLSNYGGVERLTERFLRMIELREPITPLTFTDIMNADGTPTDGYKKYIAIGRGGEAFQAVAHWGSYTEMRSALRALPDEQREDVPGRHHLAAQLQKRHGATIVASSL